MNRRERNFYLELTTNQHRPSNFQGNMAQGLIGFGEASTVAVSKFRYDGKCCPVIDDKQGRKIAEIHLKRRHIGLSVDFFLSPLVISELGDSVSSESLFLALRDGGMRIRECHYEQVIEIIGKSNARKCATLTKLNRMFGIV